MTAEELRSRAQADLRHIPRGDITQNVLRGIYTQRRRRDLAMSPSTPSRVTLLSAVVTMQLTIPTFRPLYHADYFEEAA